MDDDGIFPTDAVDHFDQPIQAGLAEADHGERRFAVLQCPHAGAAGGMFDRGVGQGQSGLGDRRLDGDFGHFANAQARWNLVEADLGDAFLGHAVAQGFDACHLAGQRLARIAAQGDAGCLANGQPARTALVETHLDPQAIRFDQADHRLAGNDRRARLRVAAGHDAVARRQQAQVLPLFAQGILVGLEPGEFLTGALQVRFGRVDRSLGRGQFLLPAFDGAGADEMLVAKIAVTPGIQPGNLPSGQHVLALCFRRRDGTLGAGMGGFQRTQPLIEIDRVDLGQQLPGLDAIADIDMDRLQAPGGGGADEITAAGFDGADAEQFGAQRALFGMGDGHLGWRQRAGAGHDQPESTEQNGSQKAQTEAAAGRLGEFHATSLMASR